MSTVLPATGITEVLYTARAMRRLRPDPVPVEVLAELVEAATMAPTASYRQNWRFVVVNDPGVIDQLGQIHARIFEFARPLASATLPEGVFRSVAHLGTKLGEAPALVVVGGTEAPDGRAGIQAFRTWYAGILPAVQNLILAARARGLGTTLTTLLLEGAHDEVRDLLGIPEDVVLVAVLPVGYPSGHFGRPPRLPVSEVGFLNHYGTPLPDPPKSDS